MEVVSTSYPEHVLRKIHDCTFRPKDFLSHFFHPNSPGNLFISTLKNYDDLILVIDSKSPFFHYFFSTFHNKTSGFSLNFYFSSLKNSKFLFYSSTINTPTFSPFPLTLYSSLQKHPFITARFRSSLHILCITAR